MNKNKLKTYAPQARREFIQAVTDRAAHYGLSAKKIEPMTEQGDVAIIGGRPFPKAVGDKRKKLNARIQKLGFGQTMEAMAYTWFNRLVAIRFMELHGYLEHGYRVLSAKPTTDNTDNTDKSARSQSVSSVKSVVQTPEILEKAQHVDLPRLDKQKVVALKLDGTKEEELYRLLLVGQCNALHKALPFLFEAIDGETELLLPDHLLHSDSLIRKLVEEIPEEDWQEVEIIGWLYQFYISEKKDEVIGKVVKSEDIPAATQLFTPNWIVKYLVQNSLGRLWLEHHPNSPLKAKMEYYIEPAEQTPEVQEQLQQIIRQRALEKRGLTTDNTDTTDGKDRGVPSLSVPSVSSVVDLSLNPEKLSLLDPACGSGHILVEAYDLLQRIYQERGYRAKDIPRLILEKNLFGLEIDDRAAQLAAFALMMKARADDRSIFERGVQPNVLSIQESKGLDAKEITEALNQPILRERPPPSGELFEEIADTRSPLFSKKSMGVKGAVSQADVAHLISLFEHGKTFGSLIQVPETLAEKLPALAEGVDAVIAHGGMFEKAAARILIPLVEQAQMLARKYDAVVANPPYMGRKGYDRTLKGLVESHYPDTKADLYGCFIQRNLCFCRHAGYVGVITLPSWMFIAAFEPLRSSLLQGATIDSFVHIGRGAWGSDFGSCCFVLRNLHNKEYVGTFKRLFDAPGSVASVEELRERFFSAQPRCISAAHFSVLPGCPIAYWIGEGVVGAFERFGPLGSCTDLVVGLFTCDNDRFLRLWHEICVAKIGFGIRNRDEAQDCGRTWFPHAKGGAFRKWYGNNEYVVFFEDDGKTIREHRKDVGQSYSLPGEAFYFREGVTWSETTISTFSARYCDAGSISNVKGPIAFHKQPQVLLAFLCSKVCSHLMNALNPTVNFNVGNVASLPFDDHVLSVVEASAQRYSAEALSAARLDWNSQETSWEFQRFDGLDGSNSMADAFEVVRERISRRFFQMKQLEEENNRLFISTYGLHDELTPEVPDEQITLYRHDREEDIRRLISYSVGCMMGRYSLDEPGLIYAHSGNKGFNPSKYRKFPADEDGIIPFTEFNWFPDDAASRFEKFIATAWPAETLEENLTFVAESLGTKKGETPRDTIRRYLANDFYKHHLSMYKKRPIYWLFSSGKQRGFQALVYLHRYNEGTLARMRTEYVIPLLGKMTARIAHLTDDSAAATSSQHKKRLETEKAAITKQLAEVQAFDEQLRHFADQRIKLDLDDGVKVNYGKFGDLLAEVKAVTGTKAED